MLLKNEGSADTRLISARTFIASFTTSRPNTRTSPSSGSSSVLTMRIRVDLPLPLAPMTPKISPRLTAIFTLSTTRRGPSFLPSRFCQGSLSPPPPNVLATPRAVNGDRAPSTGAGCGNGSSLSCRVMTMLTVHLSCLSERSLLRPYVLL